MVRASDCGPEGRRFDPDIPPHNGRRGIGLEVTDLRNKSRRLVFSPSEARLPGERTRKNAEIRDFRRKTSGCSTAVSISVFQTEDQSSTLCTRTINFNPFLWKNQLSLLGF